MEIINWSAEWWRIVVTLVASYLLGSVNCSLLVSTIHMKMDIRKHGSGNAGLTNTIRVMGKKWGAVVMLGDTLKGVLAMLLGLFLFEPVGMLTLGQLIAGVSVILGHIFPMFFSFKGGKGVMTTAAVALMMDWQVALISIAVFAVVVLISRYVSLGSIIAAITMPLCNLAFTTDIYRIILTCMLAVLLIYLHLSNINRLIHKTENKFSFKSKPTIEQEKNEDNDNQVK